MTRRATRFSSGAVARALLAAALAAFSSGGAARGWDGHAVIVGISDYPGVANDLETCDDDALDIYQVLLSDPVHWPSGNITLLTDQAATASAISAALDARFTAATDSDVCLFFFSGHGTQLVDGRPGDLDPNDESDSTTPAYDEALCAWDDTNISDDELAAWLIPHNSKRICIITDVCHAGGLAKSFEVVSDPWVDGFAGDILLRVLPAPKAASRGVARDISGTGQPGIVMLMASTDEQSSVEDPILQNGVFSFYVIEALSRSVADTDLNGCVAAEEVFAYALPLVVAWNPYQTPQLYDTCPGRLDIITAADRPLPPIVTVEDFPFGGGCAPGRAASRRRAAGLVMLGVLAFVVSRRRAAAALVLVAALFAGCAGTSPTAGPRPGVRVGLAAPFAEENATYRAAAQYGLFARGTLPGTTLMMEAGVDFFSIEAEEKPVDGRVYAFRVDLMLGPEFSARSFLHYFSAGPRFLYDEAETYWGGGVEIAAGLGFGFGVRGAERGWDVRATVDWLAWSNNTSGIFGLTAGWSF